MPKYWYRLLVFALVLVAAPVISVGTISYYIASQNIEKKVNEGNVHILLQNQMRIEQALKNVELGAVQYVSSSLVTEHLYTRLTFNDFQKIRELSTGLYNLHSTAGVEDAYLINADHGWMISNLGFTPSDRAPIGAKLAEYADRKQKLFWLATRSRDEAAADAESSRDLGLIRLVIKLPMVATAEKPKAFLIIDLSPGALEQDLAQQMQWGSIYILNREREPFLASPGSAPASSDILDGLRAADRETGYFVTGGMAVNYRVSSYNDWVYASVVAMEDITRETKRISMITIAVCLAVFVMIAGVALYGTRRMYSPIRRLVSVLEEIGGETPSPKKRDEFAIIEDRVFSLFSTRKELQQQLRGQRGQVKEFLLTKLFMGQISESEFMLKSASFGFAEKGTSFGVLALQIDSLQGTRYLESDRELLLFAVNNIVSELLPAERTLGTLLMDQSQVTLLAGATNDRDELRAYLYRTSETIKSKVQELLQLKVSIGISRPFYRYAGASVAYTEALEALKHRIRIGSEIILSYEDVETNRKVPIPPSAAWLQTENQLLDALKSGDEAAAREWFDKHVRAIVQSGVAFDDFQMVMMQLIARIHSTVQQHGGKLDAILGSTSVIHRFMKLQTVEDISAWFTAVLFPRAVRFLQDVVEKQHKTIAQRMVELIHEQFDRDLTLESCAEQLRFHPVYVSRVFKKEIGSTFIDYLTEYRMNMAKKWLLESDLKIAEIAERLNYNSATGFIRTFRKSTGMTPGQFREQQNHASG